MAVNDFSNQNIQDTYQRVVQTDGTNVADGTGSLLPISFEGNDVIIPGALKAQSYIVSESIVNVSSGSTVFGDSADDSHSFNGAITASGGISSSGQIDADKIRTGGRVASSVFDIACIGSIDTDGEMSCTGFSNSSISIFGGRLDIVGGSSYVQTESYVSASQLISSGHITASGNISASGHITASDMFLSGDLTLGKTDDSVLTIVSDGSNISHEIHGRENQHSFLSTRTTQNLGIGLNTNELPQAKLHVSGNISASGDLNITNITASGNISASGHIDGNTITSHGTLRYNGSIIGESGDGTTHAIIAQDEQLSIGGFTGPNPSSAIQIASTKTKIIGSVTASSDISASGNIIGSNIIANSSSIASRVTTLEGVNHTNSALTVDNTTLQLNIGTTYNGAAARTISVKDGGIDSDALAADIEVTSLTTERISSTNITASGNISSSGTITAASYVGLPSGIVSGAAQLPEGLISSSQHIFTAITSSGNISASGDVEALTFTSPTLDVTGGSAQMTVDRPLTFGSLVTTDLGRLNIKHDDSEGTISNVVGDLTITNSGTGDTVIANQGSTGKIVLAPNETPGPNVNSGQVLISGTSGNDGAPPHLMVEGEITSSGNISSSGTIIGNTATFSNYGSPGNVGTMLIDQIISSSTNVLSVGDFNGSNAGVRMELNQSTNKVEVKNADLVVGVADSNIQSLVVTNHITASGNVSASGNLIANDYNIGSINFGSITSGVTRIADGTQKTDIFGTNIALREGPVTASGDISSSGEIFATDFHAPISINDGYHIGTGKPILSITDGGALNLGANHSTYQAAGVNIFVTGSDGSKGLFLDTSGNVTASGVISSSATSGINEFGTDLRVFGKIISKGSDVTIGGGHISMSGHISGGLASTASFAHIVTQGSTIEFRDGASKLGTIKMTTTGDMTIGDETTSGKSKLKVADFTAAHITASGNISGSLTTTGSFSHLIASNIQGAGNPSSVGLEVDGYISSSGNISSSANIYASGSATTGFHLTNIHALGLKDNTTGSIFTDASTTHIIMGREGGSKKVKIRGSINTTETINGQVGLTEYITGSHTTDGITAQGEIVKFGQSLGLTAGAVYYLKQTGVWVAAQANAGGAATGSLAVALGSSAKDNGMLLRGMVKLEGDPQGVPGQPLYLDDTGAGRTRLTAPDTAGDYARVVGYYISGSGTVYFNPDNTWVKVS